MAKASHKDRLSLIEEITTAFEGVAREDGVTLHEAMVIDDYGSAEECAEARKKDTETKWQDVPADDICSSDAVLSFLDNKGFHYYIPAYVVWYLENIDHDDPDHLSSNAFSSVVFHLTYELKGQLRDKSAARLARAERFEFFTNEQRRAIAHFLEFEAEREEKLERQHIRASLYQGGLQKTEVNKILQEHKIEDGEIRQAIKSYWGQFM